MFHRHFAHFQHQRIFEKGDLKYVILNLVKDKPSHGYEIMRALEESFHGFYTPSAGSVYPTLQMLEDIGYVSVSEQEGKKIYAITEEGKKFLAEKQESIDRIKEHMKDWWGPHHRGDFHESVMELRDLWRLHRAVPPGSEKWDQIKEIIKRARKEIQEIVEKD